MTGKTHQILGITAGLGYYLVLNQPTFSPATMGAIIVGSHFAALLPDIDQPAATFWNNIPLGKTAGKITDSIFKHRNITHSLLGFALVGWGVYALINLFPDYWRIDRNITLAVFLVAYASHLLADMLTVEGIPLFFPWKRSFGLPPKPFHGLRIQTGKWFENLVIFPLLNILLIGLIYFYWSIIKTALFKN